MKMMLIAAGLAVVMSASGQAGQKKVTASGNPFLKTYSTPFNVPPFDAINVEHYKEAFLLGMKEQKAEMNALVKKRSMPDFENTIVALDQSGTLLKKVSSVFYGLNSANTNDQMQALSKELSPLLSAHGDDISLNPALFARVKQVYDRRASFNLNPEQTKLLEETYKGFVRGGANLDAASQTRLRQLNSEIAMLQLTFGQNMLKETNAYQLVIDRKEDLAGLPDNLIASAAEVAKAAGKEGKWVFTLQNPSVMPFLQYADNRELRRQIFNAYTNRCNNDNDQDNKAVVKQLLACRLEKARLMGYPDYASFVLEERMSKKSEKVYTLLDQIWTPALVKANEELADIRAEINKEGGNFEPEGWDWRYYFEKAKKAKFNLDENEVRPYLELNNVREGMFYVANKLYGITFKPLNNLPMPHPEAEAFECKDSDGTHLGVLYLDYFPRASKRGGAWCGTYRSQTYEKGARVAPVVTIVCNFTKPAAGQAALLSADETSTMFHEFGHALHNLFKDVRYYGVAGVPRDFVELPSQVMEHWVFEPEVLKVYAKHYQTGEVIPTHLIEKLDKSGKYGQGFATAEYLAASLLDMDFHVLKEIPADLNVVDFEADALSKRGLLKQIPARYRTTYFNHTMGGGYTAGYYSYIWAEVLDSDAYNAFQETGNIFNKEVADKFRRFILTPGGIDDAMDMYTNFRGKEPGIQPLLKNRGLN
ncbi:M3 family metallopeptidase [Bacteroides sp.]|uniref:M3 family metallopeptidase n=1 Tax=Bacteroides sp. TaxID=29523 RepID=UPI001B4F847A|nr:M3 family metallopeptidase [Bacteroides sp.]MBP6068413.1 M3 family metallopeptidase [Bacteroides sp.]MBP6937454.1 M3 family metallopeptidase [Bacteroides sp.]MBP8622950.1 M3 family metallopeptidase [Bacteroides sp.]MBP9586344.1 M3 family metallopeptidase [Bacteroides sp.]